MNSIVNYMPGLGKDFFIDPTHVNTKGGAEKYIPGLGKQVLVPTSCISAEGGADKYIPGLGKQFYINPSHIDMTALSVSLSQVEPVALAVKVTSVISGGVAPVTTKYLSGTKVIADFVSAGTAFSGTFNVTANGTYTVYAKDILGNSLVKTITVSSL